MFDAGLRKADLARKLNLSPSVVDRLLSLTHASRIEQIETALAPSGKKLFVGVREPAWRPFVCVAVCCRKDHGTF